MYLIANGRAIRERRKAAGLSQMELSKLAGFGEGNTAICRIERSKHKVHPFRAKAVANVLGCSVDELFEKAEKKIS